MIWAARSRYAGPVPAMITVGVGPQVPPPGGRRDQDVVTFVAVQPPDGQHTSGVSGGEPELLPHLGAAPGGRTAAPARAIRHSRASRAPSRVAVATSSVDAHRISSAAPATVRAERPVRPAGPPDARRTSVPAHHERRRRPGERAARKPARRPWAWMRSGSARRARRSWDTTLTSRGPGLRRNVDAVTARAGQSSRTRSARPGRTRPPVRRAGETAPDESHRALGLVETPPPEHQTQPATCVLRALPVSDNRPGRATPSSQRLASRAGGSAGRRRPRRVRSRAGRAWPRSRR